MLQLTDAICCTECTHEFTPHDGYLCTMADHDLFRCPDCGSMCSRPIENGTESDAET